MAKLKMAITFLYTDAWNHCYPNLNIWLNCSELKLKWVACGTPGSYDRYGLFRKTDWRQPRLENAERPNV